MPLQHIYLCIYTYIYIYIYSCRLMLFCFIWTHLSLSGFLYRFAQYDEEQPYIYTQTHIQSTKSGTLVISSTSLFHRAPLQLQQWHFNIPESMSTVFIIFTCLCACVQLFVTPIYCVCLSRLMTVCSVKTWANDVCPSVSRPAKQCWQSLEIHYCCLITADLERDLKTWVFLLADTWNQIRKAGIFYHTEDFQVDLEK